MTSESMYLPMNLAKKSQFHFSFFKVDSWNPKFNREYLFVTFLLQKFLIFFCFFLGGGGLTNERPGSAHVI